MLINRNQSKKEELSPNIHMQILHTSLHTLR